MKRVGKIVNGNVWKTLVTRILFPVLGRTLRLIWDPSSAAADKVSVGLASVIDPIDTE